MKMRETPARMSPWSIGLAFIFGIAIFFTLLPLARRWMAAGYEPLIESGKRTVGTLHMPLLVASAQTAAADATPESWDLAAHRGKVVVVNYFATWCGPCIGELPDLDALKKQYETRGVTFAAVSLDRNEDARDGSRTTTLRNFLQTTQFTWPILLPPDDHSIWRVSMPIPQTFLYDKQGRIARIIVGAIPGQGVEKSIDELLAEP